MPEIVKRTDMQAARQWIEAAFFGDALDAGASHFPISFRYGEREPARALEHWIALHEPGPVAEGHSVDTLVRADPATGLECRCEIKTFAAFPAVEWVAYFRNGGTANTPLLSEILPLDLLLPAEASAPCRVHHARGSLAQPDDFAPLETPLTFRQGASRLELSARTGKSSTLHLPFFNLEVGRKGVICAIGWSGGWSARFERKREGVRVRAGMERTHLILRPGEQIRTPRILLLFWEADGVSSLPEERARSQNMLRRLILAHYTPQPSGRLLQPPFCEGVWGARTEESHLAKIEWLMRNRMPAECYWIDAGWYGERPLSEAAEELSSGWMKQVGSWFPVPEAYPRGFAPIGAAAREAGLGLLLWVEPERAFEGTQMVRQHPEWLIGPARSGNVDGVNYMVNLGIPEARRHISDLISDLIGEGGISCYRHDFNDLRVPELCAMADAPDRVGMTEIGHITGLYALWDELLARHPGLIIDNCAGGGQRIDLETIARSVPLWRSDLQCWPFDPLSMQTQTQGLAPWVPLSAAVCDEPTPYALRSALGPGLVTHWSSQALDGGVELPTEEIRRLMHEALAMRKYFYGDFYPLLSFSLADDAWAAWQLDRPDLGEGMVVAFRRRASSFRQWEAKLQALDPASEYELYSWDARSTCRMTGRQLMADGLVVTIDDRPGSALFTYKSRQFHPEEELPAPTEEEDPWN